jgi:hypothetical protein
MTEYEKFSLALLSQIATGIKYMLDDSSFPKEHYETWSESLKQVLENIAIAGKSRNDL